jgi:integrase/recombinase XerD
MHYNTVSPLQWIPGMTWPEFWHDVKKRLKQCGYSRKTLILYRQVLRQFRDYNNLQPSSITNQTVKMYIHHLVDQHCTWSWIGTNISVLRTVFDKIGKRHLTDGLITPKRPITLPEILSQHEVSLILESAETIRDQLILGLLYGCGLKTGELCSLRWRNIDIQNQALVLSGSAENNNRTLQLPPALLPVLTQGVNTCAPSDYIFMGRKTGTPLSPRMVQLILRKAAKTAGTLKPVNCMTLRHSYAVHCLEAGRTIREVQEALGHRSIKTTMIYESCILPKNIENPISRVRALYTEEPASEEVILRKPVTPCNNIKYDHTSLLKNLQLPFIDESSISVLDRTKEFLKLIKTRIKTRFLTF